MHDPLLQTHWLSPCVPQGDKGCASPANNLWGKKKSFIYILYEEYVTDVEEIRL